MTRYVASLVLNLLAIPNSAGVCPAAMDIAEPVMKPTRRKKKVEEDVSLKTRRKEEGRGAGRTTASATRLDTPATTLLIEGEELTGDRWHRNEFNQPSETKHTDSKDDEPTAAGRNKREERVFWSDRVLVRFDL